MRPRDDGSYLYSPTDLVNFLGCSHSTVLDLLTFTQPLQRDEVSEAARLLQKKGAEHEAAYLQSLKDKGKRIAEIPTDGTVSERAAKTTEALKRGVDVIYQAALLGDRWGGYADFLVKTDFPSALGAFSYEAVDTKLSRHAEPKHLIQLGVYSGLLAAKQGAMPTNAHLVLGDGGQASFSLGDYSAYVRHAMRRLEHFAAAPPTDSYPVPCGHCAMCHWKDHCGEQWERDDHLSLVANLQRTQAVKLQQAGVTTVAALAGLSAEAHIPDLNPQVFARLRSQAVLQVHKRTTGENKVELISTDPGRGFDRLPKPHPADLFFDMEGDPLYPDGLEYLFGVCVLAGEKLSFRAFWAHDHEQEKLTFAQFMEFLDQHLTEHPHAFIYHYNHYEVTALKRLAGRYAVAEHQLDDLLRRKKFVDLYKVVREGIRVSEPSYSLKILETFYMEKREGEVATAGDSIVVYNQWRDTGEQKLLDDIAAYNEVDCISTAKLRDWLLSLRPNGATWFTGQDSLPAEDMSETSAARFEREAIYMTYLGRLQAVAHAQEHHRRLADLLGFHAREARPQWWELFDRQDRFEDELLDDAECLAALEQFESPAPVKQSLVYSYRFPPQETKRQAGDQITNAATAERAGVIVDLDEDSLIVRIKLGVKSGELPQRLSIGPDRPVNTNVLRDAIYRFTDALLAGSNSYAAIRDILSKALPRLKDRRPGDAIAQGADLLAATTEAIAALDDSYLFIQGPPGAGKTHTTAQVIVELIRRGKKVGVTANSHKAIHNLLDKVEEMAAARNVGFDGIKKSSGDDSEYFGRCIRSEKDKSKISLGAQLLAGTAWLFADERFDQHLDYLFLDEAGQVSLANVVAMGTAARNMVLVGDQMQLGQPVQGVHPGEAGLSILDFLLGNQATVAPERGIFLAHTHRLHPSICRFISDAFYERRLAPHPDNAKRRLVFDAPIDGITPEGIHFLPVSHVGCSQKSEEEASRIKQVYQKLIGQTFVEKDGTSWRITADDILVVSPYNVQVNHLKSILPAGARVGTVDKFQGQEAPIVLVSMATSDAECMPRNIAFLFSANRLNVALSRAKCLAVVAASPKLLETPCRSIEQMRLVNKFCQLVEYCSDERRLSEAVPGAGVGPVAPSELASQPRELVSRPRELASQPIEPATPLVPRQHDHVVTKSALGLTNYHAKYFAHELTRRSLSGPDRLSMSLFDAAVDLNPHQIEAALFALQSPLSKGVILADEVGLGKTIEAGIVLCQSWAERKRKLLVICPASIRKQWALELTEKFNLPAIVLDARSCRDTLRLGRAPLAEKAVLVMSFNFANKIRDDLKTIAWDLVVIDEAHKLRNAYRPSNKVGQGIRWATEDCRKLLLTATPLQNSLVELYGLATLIDPFIFGDISSFRAQFTGAGSNLDALRQRLSTFCKRTLRNQVTEFIRYTQRRPITRPFKPSDDEHALYEAVSAFLQREDSYALPQRQRHLTALVLRKLLASSSQAIAATLGALRARLETLRDQQAVSDPEFTERLIETEEFEDDLLDEILNEETDAAEAATAPATIDRQKLKEEIAILDGLAKWAHSIGIDTKTRSLLTALELGFEKMAAVGAAKKAIIFTESRRTQEHLKFFLEAHGYRGQVVLFNGTNSGPEATAIHERWAAANRASGRASGSRAIDVRTALIEHFRDNAAILLATEAAAEGVNLQFCALLVNYDLPWNPQRIEQRIGRCHRYGQKHDVVVVNFLNERNAADQRVLELLSEKFRLFDGVFGASDDVLGSIESGVDFEKRILAIYQQCRSPVEIDAAFRKLQEEMDEQIRKRLDDTRRTLLEHFDEDVHARLRLQLADTTAQLDRVSKRFWAVTRFILEAKAQFDESTLAFQLVEPPRNDIPLGRYHLISKTRPQANSLRSTANSESGDDSGQFLYRLSHPLGEWVLDRAKAADTPSAHVAFDVTHHPTRSHAIEALRGQSGYLTLCREVIDSFETEEHLLFSGFADGGQSLDQETMEKLFQCSGHVHAGSDITAALTERLAQESARHAEATVSRSLEANSRHFQEAREKLERWADDMILAAEKALRDTKEKIKVLQRDARQAATLADQHRIQEEIQKLEKVKSRQRQEIFKAEDEIIEKRESLIESLERRLRQRTHSEKLFTIRWSVV
jgi:predicted RecB family nuclease